MGIDFQHLGIKNIVLMHVMHRNWYINITRVLSVCFSMLYMLVHLLHIGFGFKAQRRFQKFGEVQWQLIDLNTVII